MTTFTEKKLGLDLQVINVVNQNVTKSWKHTASYAFTLSNTMQTLTDISQKQFATFMKIQGKLTVYIDADWIGLSFKMPFKTLYHLVLSFFCANAYNEFTQKFIQLGGRNFSYFTACFSFCLKELCKQSNVSFCFLHCILVFLFFNKSLNGTFQRSKPWTSHVGFKSWSETCGPRLCTGEFSSFVFVIRRTMFFH